MPEFGWDFRHVCLLSAVISVLAAGFFFFFCHFIINKTILKACKGALCAI